MEGRIKQVIGPVVDVYFEKELPEINHALIVVNGTDTVHLEVALHLGDHLVRSIALEPTEGLRRNLVVESTGAPIMVPVGNPVLGRIFNVLGQPIDQKKPIKEAKLSPIHRSAPAFHKLNADVEILETGIKVIDLLAHILRVVKSVFLVVPVSEKPYLFKS